MVYDNITNNNKYLSKYLDDSYIKQMKKISIDDTKITDSTRKENTFQNRKKIKKK